MNWRPARLEERQLAAVWIATSVSSLAVVAAAWTPIRALLRPCVFKELTGVPCPSCGSTRAVEAFIHGRLLESIALNPLFVAALAVFLVGGIAVAPIWLLLDGKIPETETSGRRVALAIATIVVANWIFLIFTH